MEWFSYRVRIHRSKQFYCREIDAPMHILARILFVCRCFPITYSCHEGWSGGAMVLGKLPVPGRPTNLDKSRARAYCACRRCGWRLFGHFSLVYHFSFLSPSLWETARYRLKYRLKGPLSPNQPTNQIMS